MHLITYLEQVFVTEVSEIRVEDSDSTSEPIRIRNTDPFAPDQDEKCILMKVIAYFKQNCILLLIELNKISDPEAG